MKISVCCSSSSDIDKKYIRSSEIVLKQIFTKDNDLIFGAMNNGIMGIAYQIAKANGRIVTGIAPEIYKDDFQQLNCDEEILTVDVESRMTAFIQKADVLVFLPGGIGTVYELMSAIERKRSNEFDKPIIIYNDTGFFNEMLNMLDKIYNENFTSSKVKAVYNIINDSNSIIEFLEQKDGKKAE